jgi:hypothetical protein
LAGDADRRGESSRQNKIRKSKDWENLASQAHGVEDFRIDTLGNCWLYHPKVLPSSRFADALRLRTNTFGVNVALRRADKDLLSYVGDATRNLNP